MLREEPLRVLKNSCFEEWTEIASFLPIAPWEMLLQATGQLLGTGEMV